VIERVEEEGRSSDGAAEAFGRSLAATHAAGASAFGVPPDGWSGDAWIGRQPLQMTGQQTWGVFYAETRVLPFARAAVAAGTLTDTEFVAVQRVCERLRAGEFDDGRPPARIHGDLWAGNVLWGPDGAVLIDPAAHGGHGETDLAMLHLFGLDRLDVVTAAYAEAAGLVDGWPERIPLHQLHPLLVHAVSHGRSYGVAAARAAARYL
jgi:fructosamine-3-kinase